MAQISRRRTDQLGNFMRVLEFRAIHLDHRARIAKQNFRRRFHHARLARAGRSEEKQIRPRAGPASSIPRETPDTDPPPPAPLRSGRQFSGAVPPRNRAIPGCVASDRDVVPASPPSCSLPEVPIRPEGPRLATVQSGRASRRASNAAASTALPARGSIFVPCRQNGGASPPGPNSLFAVTEPKSVRRVNGCRTVPRGYLSFRAMLTN